MFNLCFPQFLLVRFVPIKFCCLNARSNHPCYLEAEGKPSPMFVCHSSASPMKKQVEGEVFQQFWWWKYGECQSSSSLLVVSNEIYFLWLVRPEQKWRHSRQCLFNYGLYSHLSEYQTFSFSYGNYELPLMTPEDKP